jgi:hypothetical protein
MARCAGWACDEPGAAESVTPAPHVTISHRLTLDRLTMARHRVVPATN